jgi:hypothetical protein
VMSRPETPALSPPIHTRRPSINPTMQVIVSPDWQINQSQDPASWLTLRY